MTSVLFIFLPGAVPYSIRGNSNQILLRIFDACSIKIIVQKFLHSAPNTFDRITIILSLKSSVIFPVSCTDKRTDEFKSLFVHSSPENFKIFACISDALLFLSSFNRISNCDLIV